MNPVDIVNVILLAFHLLFGLTQAQKQPAPPEQAQPAPVTESQ